MESEDSIRPQRWVACVPAYLSTCDIRGRDTYVTVLTSLRKVRIEVSVRERTFPRTCGHACASDHAARDGGGGWPGERVRGSLLRPGRRRREPSERHRDANLPRPSVSLTARANNSNPVYRCAPLDRKNREESLPVTLTNEDIPRRTAVVAAKRSTKGHRDVVEGATAA